MPDTGTPVARSPIATAPPEIVRAGWAVSGARSGAVLTLTDCTPLTKVAVKAVDEQVLATVLDVPFGRAARQDWGLDDGAQVLVVGSGPGERLVLAAPGRQTHVVDRLAQLTGDALVSVVDLTHGRALVRLAGGGSARLLAHECAVDLGEAMCPDGTALRTAVAGLATDFVRDDRAGMLSYLLHCERSSGQYLFDSLRDAGVELGAEVDGFVPPGI